jgi:hypothetical protein
MDGAVAELADAGVGDPAGEAGAGLVVAPPPHAATTRLAATVATRSRGRRVPWIVCMRAPP